MFCHDLVESNFGRVILLTARLEPKIFALSYLEIGISESIMTKFKTFNHILNHNFYIPFFINYYYFLHSTMFHYYNKSKVIL